ncbi:5-methylcytosine-specific restriction endonuclease McrA [Paucibacter oligotrophus]|uniref:5-methylcytosine-specific restriction endonuclease McrA n=1 Tax=Roseateles oligotrophus TaxID=1769250 RepID=A0A840LII8_9BURK|nr:HNH endonuclease [Roseateles oligotrophus]MBB4846018.1 5-methylcytosine-specific restriction endonuclease McrA [Roseateles oligotrophus]
MNLFVINTDLKDDAVDAEHHWFHRGIAVTSGGARYRNGLQRPRGGDLLALYVNGRGIAAVGRAVNDTVVDVHGDGLVNPKEQEEYHRAVVWQYDLRDKPITVSDLRKLSIFGQNAVSQVKLTSAYQGFLQLLAGRPANPQSDRTELRRSAALVQKTGPLTRPAGSRNPVQKQATGLVFDRDPAVKAWTLRRSKGLCECCRKKAPFTDKDGIPYLESHHIVHLANGGPDTPDNAASVCPNCHRELHHASASWWRNCAFTFSRLRMPLTGRWRSDCRHPTKGAFPWPTETFKGKDVQAALKFE